MLRYLITLQAPDRKGLVEQIANVISRHNGNWLDSEMRHIDGVFAAILQLEVSALKWDAMLDALECIDGLNCTYCKTGHIAEPIKRLSFNLVAYDREGLVLEISNKINALGINIEQFSSQLDCANHTGIAVFKATIHVASHSEITEEQIEEALYSIGDDVLIDSNEA